MKHLLRRVQALAKEYELELRYRWDDAGYYVCVDGPLPMMQAMTYGLETELMRCVESEHATSEYIKTKIAQEFADSHLEGLKGSEEMVSMLASKFADHGWSAAPQSYDFDCGLATDLKGQLRLLKWALVAYDNGDRHPNELVEVLHTTIEAVMNRWLGEEKLSFGQSAKKLVDDPELLIKVLEMKNLRRDSKHRNQHVSDVQLRSILGPCLDALHLLLAPFQNQ